MMFKRLQRSFQADPSSQRPSTVGYEAIDSDDATTSHVAGSQSDLAVEESGRAVYWCFWALGAGVLLSWNGMQLFFLLRTYAEGDEKQAVTDTSSSDMLVPAPCIVLSGRVELSGKPCKSLEHDVLLW